VFPVCRSLSRPYVATSYRAEVAGRWLVLRLGRHDPAADAALARHGVRSATFVTAWNPLGRRAPQAVNRRALARLRKGLDVQWTPPRSRDELHER